MYNNQSHTVQTVLKPNNRMLAFDPERIMRYGDRIMHSYPQLNRERWHRGVLSKLQHSTVQAAEINQSSIMTALELVTKEEPEGRTRMEVHGRSFLVDEAI